MPVCGPLYDLAGEARRRHPGGGGAHAAGAALDPGAAGVKLDGAGFVAVDEELRTSNPAVFAAGDVTGTPQYVYAPPGRSSVPTPWPGGRCRPLRMAPRFVRDL